MVRLRRAGGSQDKARTRRLSAGRVPLSPLAIDALASIITNMPKASKATLGDFIDKKLFAGICAVAEDAPAIGASAWCHIAPLGCGWRSVWIGRDSHQR